jgi:Tfp pilus assembly protein PilO
MKLEMNSRNRTIVAILIVAALAIAFWMLLLGPKRDESSKLGLQVSKLESSLAANKAVVQTALESRQDFARDYRKLVVLGKAVPGDDDTASLFAQLNKIAKRTGVRFQLIELEGSAGEEADAAEVETAPTEGPGSTTAGPVSPTEVAAATMPLGATIGPAGLGVMPYKLVFGASFFHIADFIKDLDALVRTENERLSVSGRLITLNGFSLKPNNDKPFPALEATFSITTYVVPPEVGVTGGATPTAPLSAAPPTAAPAATTTGGTP